MENEHQEQTSEPLTKKEVKKETWIMLGIIGFLILVIFSMAVNDLGNKVYLEPSDILSMNETNQINATSNIHVIAYIIANETNNLDNLKDYSNICFKNPKK